MPWQLSGNGRSDWSTKLIRGLKAEAAAGFQSRRERCREPTPVTPQYAAFATYEAAQVHNACWWCSGCMAACGAGAAAEGARDWVSRQQVAGCGGEPSDRISPRLEGGRLCRGRKYRNRIPVGRE